MRVDLAMNFVLLLAEFGEKREERGVDTRMLMGLHLVCFGLLLGPTLLTYEGW